MSIGVAFALRPWLARLARKTRPRAVAVLPRRRLGFDALDRRELLSATPSPVSILSATTLDSQGVTFAYDLASADPSLTVGVYRSSAPGLADGARPVVASVAVPSVDDAGQPATTPGFHQVTLPLAGGLPLDPKHPYVVVVADPASLAPGEVGSSASFRKVTIGVVTHGGLQDKHWKKIGPPWAREMANALKAQGYDAVIPYNWVGDSNTPGKAAGQGPKLAKLVLDVASRFPSDEPVDLQFIGHSEGAVVNTQAIVKLEKQATPPIRAGFLHDTLLDPHAANPDFRGKQYSVAANPLGAIAKLAIDNYQARSRDPFAFIPADVDASEVYYQQTAANRDHNQNLGVYNLWGQVPVKGASTYFNLTSAGVVHSGNNGVPAWYEHHIIPTLGNGGQPAAESTLTGSLVNATGPGGSTITSHRATYSGHSQPGSTVYLRAGSAGPEKLDLVAQAIADGEGTWTASTLPLPSGRYRVVAEARLGKSYPGDRPAVPTASLGLLVVQAGKTGVGG